MEEVAERQMGWTPDMRMSIQSERHFPEYDSSVPPSSTASQLDSAASTPLSTPVGSPVSRLSPYAAAFTPSSPASTMSDDGGQQSMSFAQVSTHIFTC